MDRNLVVSAALDLLGEEGLDALSMRTLADSLGVKAASLYWHVRDRRELLELAAAAILAEVLLPRPGGERRAAALAICSSLEAVLARRRDAHRMVLEVPGALEGSAAWRALAGRLREAGLNAPEAGSTASILEAGRPAKIATTPAHEV